MKSLLYVLLPVFLSFQVAAESDIASETPEEKPAPPTVGPHQGQLVAAGTFHIEILWVGDSAKIYLLDAEYKNETVQNSEVGIFIQSGNTESEMSCQAVENHFECNQSGKKFKKGQLSVSAKRNGVQAEEVKIKVPFEKMGDEKAKKPKKK